MLNLVGVALGLVWSIAVVWLPQSLDLPFIPAPVAVPGAMIAPGLVLIGMIAAVALRRFLTEPEPLSARAEVDQSVLTETLAHLVLALVVWPFVANSLGGAMVLAMGFSFALARLVSWAGAYLWSPLRWLGFSATFFPTVVAAIWSVAAWSG